MVCPNPELLSAWLDGEVPSPWKEALAQHVQGCPGCAGRVASYRQLSAGLDRPDVACQEPVLARQRVFERLQKNIVMKQHRSHLLRRRLLVPLPFAAAAALVIGFLGVALLVSGQRNSQLRLAVRQATEARQVASNSIGMESIMEYLSQQDSGVSITISLPQGSGFEHSGEPFIVREADFQPAGGNQ